MGLNTFQAICGICQAADTPDQVVKDIATLAGRWVFDSVDYDAQMEVLRSIRDMAHGRLGANDIDWDASGALDAIHDITRNVLGEDN